MNNIFPNSPSQHNAVSAGRLIDEQEQNDAEMSVQVAASLRNQSMRLSSIVPGEITSMRERVDYYTENKKVITANASVAIDDERADLKEQNERRQRQIDAIDFDINTQQSKTQAEIYRLRTMLEAKEQSLNDETKKIVAEALNMKAALISEISEERKNSEKVISQIEADCNHDIELADRYLAGAEAFFAASSKDVSPTDKKPK